jgi:L,D-peptidoglycan transpeptidase YkuD (ErfK/YbiS/YcfS/YnhG family)
MLISVKNKETLIVDEFKFRCSIGKNGTIIKKKEGDYKTPVGEYKIGKLYYRADRVQKPKTLLHTKIIKKSMGWCNDPLNKLYNKEIKINDKIKCEKLYRRDYKYDYFIVIEYNTKKITPYKGSAIFIHLTKDYATTEGCIVLSKKDFLILINIINKKSSIKIN